MAMPGEYYGDPAIVAEQKEIEALCSKMDARLKLWGKWSRFSAADAVLWESDEPRGIGCMTVEQRSDAEKIQRMIARFMAVPSLARHRICLSTKYVQGGDWREANSRLARLARAQMESPVQICKHQFDAIIARAIRVLVNSELDFC